MLAIRAWRWIATEAAVAPLALPCFFDCGLPISALLIDGFRNGCMASMQVMLTMAWPRCTMKTLGNGQARWI